MSKSIGDMQAELLRIIKLAKYSPVRNGIGLAELNPAHIANFASVFVGPIPTHTGMSVHFITLSRMA